MLNKIVYFTFILAFIFSFFFVLIFKTIEEYNDSKFY